LKISWVSEEEPITTTIPKRVDHMPCTFFTVNAVCYALGAENCCSFNLYVGTTVFVEDAQQRDEFKLIN